MGIRRVGGSGKVNEGVRRRGRRRGNDWKEAMATGGFVHDRWGWREGGTREGALKRVAGVRMNDGGCETMEKIWGNVFE